MEHLASGESPVVVKRDQTLKRDESSLVIRKDSCMQLTEQHVIRRDDPRFTIIDAAAFRSKNLYNAALYEMRQAFIFQGKRLSYEQMDTLMQPHEAYKALPAKVSQQVLKQLAQAWESYFEACQAYKESPAKFLDIPDCRSTKIKPKGATCLSIRGRH